LTGQKFGEKYFFFSFFCQINVGALYDPFWALFLVTVLGTLSGGPFGCPFPMALLGAFFLEVVVCRY
jgi:hypothetical protein